MRGRIRIKGADPERFMTPEQVKEHVDRVYEAVKGHAEKVREALQGAAVPDFSPILEALDEMDRKIARIETRIAGYLARPSMWRRLAAWIGGHR
ncbi:MAG: hypothetical protein ABSC19_05030 [Syntrophorhabdales bacterium]|jgi:hypothetical protein